MAPREIAGQPSGGPPPGVDPYAKAEAAVRATMDDWDDEAAPEEAAPAQQEQPEPRDETSKASVDDSEGSPSASAPKAEVEKARSAAKYAKLPESVVASMSDEDLLEWHSGWAKNDADVKRAFRENADLRRELEKFQATKAAEPAVPTAAEDPELAAVLTEEFGAERGKKLAALIAQRDAQSMQKVQALEATLEQRLAKSAWKEVSQRLGIEGDASAYDRVMQQARSLARIEGPWSALPEDERIPALFTHAARMVMPELPSEPELRRRAAISEARRNGAPTAAPQRAAPKKPATRDEIESARIAAIMRGERDPSKLRAIGRS